MCNEPPPCPLPRFVDVAQAAAEVEAQEIENKIVLQPDALHCLNTRRMNIGLDGPRSQGQCFLCNKEWAAFDPVPVSLGRE